MNEKLEPTDDELRLEVENIDLRRLLAQAGIDAAEQRNIEQLQRVVLEELHHRVKNTFAVVIAIASQTLRSADSLEHGREAIENRLLAMGRVHDLLLKANWTSAGLNEILKGAVSPFDQDGKRSRFQIQASDIEVSAGAVLPLAMVINELCTNAVKYGALSSDAGGVEISSTVDPLRDQFRLRWTERGGPLVNRPKQRSFGTKLIEHSFVRQLGGEAQLSFAPSGVVCVLDIPMTSLKPETRS